VKRAIPLYAHDKERYADAHEKDENMLIVCGTILLALALIMIMAWALTLPPGRAGLVDVIWTFAVGGGGIAAALWPIAAADATPRQWLVAGLIALWSLRLGGYIFSRTHIGQDDPRYAKLREEWGAGYAVKSFFFLQIQAVAAWLLVLCIAAAAHKPQAGLSLQDMLGAALFLFAMAGEGVADAQLARFRTAHKGQKAVCNTGLWRYSRHPNYFFEWLIWVSMALIAVDFSGSYIAGLVALLTPVFMYWLLVYVSGIPLLEACMVESRGAAYTEYQKMVSAFWPAAPRQEKSA
jgi:steroid 5-alpha reductase family enzyme